MELNLPSLLPIVHSGPTPLFATISGAHLYGFSSPDSDVDLRGAFVLPLRNALRLREPRETITIMRTHDGFEIDWVAHDVRKFAQLMTRRNGYVLEQLYSPLVVAGGDWLTNCERSGVVVLCDTCTITIGVLCMANWNCCPNLRQRSKSCCMPTVSC